MSATLTFAMCFHCDGELDLVTESVAVDHGRRIGGAVECNGPQKHRFLLIAELRGAGAHA